MTPFGIRQLQVAATLAHSIPGVTLRLRSGSDPLLHVGDEPHGCGARWISACAMRRSVIDMLHTSGPDRRVAFLHLPEGEDPAIDLGAGERCRIHPGGIVTALAHGRIVHAFATTLNSVQARAAVSDRTAHPSSAVPTEFDAHKVQLHYDTGLLTTLVSIEQLTVQDDETHSRAISALHTVLARCSAEETDSDLRVLARMAS